MGNKMIPSLKVPVIMESDNNHKGDHLSMAYPTPEYSPLYNHERVLFQKRDNIVPPPILSNFVDDGLDKSPFCLYQRAMKQQRKRRQRVRTIIYGSAFLSFFLGAIVGWNWPIF